MKERSRWWTVVSFAVAMAWVEAAVVFYLRTLVGRIDPYQKDPLPAAAGLEEAEWLREVATLIMLTTVGMLAGRTRRSRFGYAIVAFGVWDIFYYAFLKLMTGWPGSLFAWDVLFLIPLPWWGPVISPMLIALLMIIAGSLLSQYDEPERPLWPDARTVMLNGIGVVLSLYVFMADALRALPRGAQAVRQVLPERFEWVLFLVAVALMAAPVVNLANKVRRGPEPAGTASDMA